jgi:DNA-binding response OmpR family regulator
LSLPDGDGLEVIRQIHCESLLPKILAISGYMVGDLPNVALSAGATATLSKPTRLRPLLDIVRLLLHMANTSPTETGGKP